MKLKILWILCWFLDGRTFAFVVTPSSRTTTTTLQQQQQQQRKRVTLYKKYEDMTEDEKSVAMEKATKAMTAFTNKYLENTGTKLCSDKSVPAVVIKGLAEHKVTLGAPLCPCRFYDNKEAEAKDGYWNCPCVPMRERHECHCMLFLTEDNAFVGDETEITYDEVIEGSNIQF